MNRHVVSLILMFFFFVSSHLINAQDQSSTIQRLQSQGLVVRVPTQSKKIKVLKEIIGSGSKNASSAQKKLSQTIKEDSTRFSNIFTAMKDNYKVTKYVFVPDSLYRRFLDNASNVFLSEDMQLIDIQGINRKDIFLMSFTDKDQFILTNEDGYVFDAPLPYKKSIFLNSIKRVFNLKKYLATQIKYFETKIKSAIKNL